MSEKFIYFKFPLGTSSWMTRFVLFSDNLNQVSSMLYDFNWDKSQCKHILFTHYKGFQNSSAIWSLACMIWITVKIGFIFRAPAKVSSVQVKETHVMKIWDITSLSQGVKEAMHLYKSNSLTAADVWIIQMWNLDIVGALLKLQKTGDGY